jgi:hypothetical protein
MGLVCHWSRHLFFSVLIFWIKMSYDGLKGKPRDHDAYLWSAHSNGKPPFD